MSQHFIFSFILVIASCAMTQPALAQEPSDQNSTTCSTPLNPSLEQIYHQILLERSTEDFLDLLEEVQKHPDLNSEWVKIELIQDQSQMEAPPKIPRLILLQIAKNSFNKKIAEKIGSLAKKDRPKLTDMKFQKENSEYRGMSVSLTASVWIEVRRENLRAVTDWFISSMYHPALGNKVFKIKLTKQ